MRSSWLVAIVCVAVAASFASANIIGTPVCQADGDGAVVCQPSAWDGQTNTLSIAETVFQTPGHVQGKVQTDGDPTVMLAKYITNSTGDTWSGYTFNIYMDQAFSIDSAMLPTGWTYSITPASTGTFVDLDGRQWAAKGTVDFVANDGAYDLAPAQMGLFGANVTFAQSVNFEIEQIGVVPEPATLALLMLGGLFVRRSRKQG